jgi:DNA polymerase III epsilon subunit-like protein
MIIIDLETTGTLPETCQMVSLGAVDYKTGDTFYGECRIYESDQWSQEALDINGFTLQQITDKTKPTPVQLYQAFVKWCEGRSTQLAGHNIAGFDVLFLKNVHRRQNKIKDFPFHFRYIDLHSVAYAKLKKSYSLKKICEKLGVPPEPDPHNALNGALAEYECFKILLND